MTKYEALLLALDRAGSQAALGEICGVTQAGVSKWVVSTKELPVIYCRAVERATGVPAYKLQPAHFDPPLNYPNEPTDWECGEYANRVPTQELAGA